MTDYIITLSSIFLSLSFHHHIDYVWQCGFIRADLKLSTSILFLILFFWSHSLVRLFQFHVFFPPPLPSSVFYSSFFIAKWIYIFSHSQLCDNLRLWTSNNKQKNRANDYFFLYYCCCIYLQYEMCYYRAVAIFMVSIFHYYFFFTCPDKSDLFILLYNTYLFPLFWSSFQFFSIRLMYNSFPR